MCGIVGFVSPRFSVESLHKMASALTHRGPDAEGFYTQASLGLGHRRLRILDLSEAANQPFHSHCGRFVMVFNGEIYNYQSLAQELPYRFKTTSDTEVLLQAFVHYGEKFTEKLNGMFAIAIYDKQSDTLHLFRDRLGIKPLHYYHQGNDFAFASEIKALLQLNIARKLDLTALQDYLFLEYIPGNRAIFSGIKKLAPGTHLRFCAGKPKLRTYYTLTEKICSEKSINYRQAQETFTETLSQSVACRTLSDVPIGAFLSGGTDSSLICALFQQHSPTSIQSFNLSFENAAYDESEWAEKVAKTLKTQHKTSKSLANQAINQAKNLYKYYDEPFASVSAIPTLQLSQQARKNVTVALSGDGGDELFMGYGYYYWYNRLLKTQNIGGYFGKKLISLLLSLGNERHQRAARVFDTPLGKHFWLHIWSQTQYMFSEKEISLLLGKNYRHQTLLPDWLRIDKLPLTPFEKISLFDLRHYLPANLLHKIDIASMANSLEVRTPFLDHRVVELALRLPQNFKIQGGEQKFLLKKVLENYLPKPLIYRKKWGFPAPMGDWLSQPLRPLLERYLSKAALKKQGIFNPRPVEQLLYAFRSGKKDHFKRVWALLYFQIWFAAYLDPEPFSNP